VRRKMKASLLPCCSRVQVHDAHAHWLLTHPAMAGQSLAVCLCNATEAERSAEAGGYTCNISLMHYFMQLLMQQEIRVS
jgi:hypothetical protein